MSVALKVIDERTVLNKEFRIYGDYENPLFLAKDVAMWIDYDVSSVNKLVNMVDEDEKTTRKILPNGSSYQTEAWFLTEDGVYEVLMQSRKPIAKKFKKQVKEILKSIRIHGGYLTPSKIEELVANPDLVIEFATALKNERLKNQQLQVESKVKDTVIAELKPKADYMDRILKSKGTVPVTAIAKDYGMSATAFNKILHDLGIQYNLSGTWFLYAVFQNCGYTHSKTFDYIDSKGAAQTRLNTQWTQKGRLFLYDLLKKNGCLPKIEQLNFNA